MRPSTPAGDAPSGALTEPVDLDNCDREPIRIPGSVQPHGVLVAVHGPRSEIVSASANVVDLTGVGAQELIGMDLTHLLGDAVARIPGLGVPHPRRGTATIEVGGRVMDVVVSDSQGLTVLEIEPAGDEDPNAPYEAVRGWVLELTATAGVDELCDAIARAVRELTGFDRVMVYRFDRDWHGEVVAEEKRDDLNPFLGLHYPATDIPAQARELYRTNWVRSIVDVGYTPAPLVPSRNPLTGEPIDLGLCALRSVSPIHIEYLQNMGVAASMSISLIVADQLWGLIACHHYAGPHHPSVPVRAAAEFLGQTVSVLLATKIDADARAEALRQQQQLGTLRSSLEGVERPTAAAVARQPELLELVGASGAAVHFGGELALAGDTPDRDDVVRVVEHLAAAGPPHVTEALAEDDPELAGLKDVASGALASFFSDDRTQYVAWFRPEVVRTVHWGGDPQNKVIAVQGDESVRLSPRKSFDRWKETVRLHSTPWQPGDLTAAEDLVGHLTRVLLRQAQEEALVARALQRNLSPERLPQIEGIDLAARYVPGGRGGIGGDWYDAFTTSDGTLVVALGDVAGHGVAAAAVMAQLQSALRAYLFQQPDPVGALHQLDHLVEELMPDEMATAVVVVLDPAAGTARLALAGHLPPLLIGPDGSGFVTELRGAALGLGRDQRSEAVLEFAPGTRLVLFTDGLIERRAERIDDGLERLRDATASASAPIEEFCDHLIATVDGADVRDDVALVVMGRPGRATGGTEADPATT